LPVTTLLTKVKRLPRINVRPLNSSRMLGVAPHGNSCLVNVAIRSIPLWLPVALFSKMAARRVGEDAL
jgi:hypothetical protein